MQNYNFLALSPQKELKPKPDPDADRLILKEHEKFRIDFESQQIELNSYGLPVQHGT
jgi:hypothetical protein